MQRDRRGYPELRRYLSQLHRQGRPVAAMLRDVPSHRLTKVAHPARYVRTVVGNHRGTTPLQQTGPDRAAMEALVRDALDPATADKVLSCRTWPKLARHLQGFTAEGLPVTQMLAALPATRVAQAVGVRAALAASPCKGRSPQGAFAAVGDAENGPSLSCNPLPVLRHMLAGPRPQLGLRGKSAYWRSRHGSPVTVRRSNWTSTRPVNRP